MEINLLPKIEFHGRNGLSRSLSARFSEASFLYTFITLSLCSGFLVVMNVSFSFSTFFKILFFAITTYIAWVLKETTHLRVHLHGERVIYELKDKGAVIFNFTDIQSIRFKHSRGVFGFFLELKSGACCHFPIHLERLDYILDTLHFHRQDLTQTDEFLKFRCKALSLDHVLAHNRSYLTRAHVKAASFCLLYPLYFKHEIRRLKENPTQVRRDMGFEKKLETLCHRVNIGVSLATLAFVVLLKYRI